MKTAVNKLLDATKLTLDGTDFGFLTNKDWFTDASSSENYAKLIAKQDEFMELALKNVQTSLDISDGSTDAYIMTRLNSLQDASAIEHITSLQSAAAIITLWRLQPNLCQPNQPKILYNTSVSTRPLTTSLAIKQGTKLSNFYLGNILIRPMLVKNVTVLSIANILKTLKQDDYSRGIITASSSDNKALEKAFLVDKYSSYIQTVSYQVTNDSPRDFLYMWGCPKTGFEAWNKFFIGFINEISRQTDTILADKTEVKHMAGASEDAEMERYGLLTGIFFKNEDKSREEILMKFMGESSMTGAYDKTAVATGRPKRQVAAGGAAAGGAESSLPPRPDIIGLLPYDEWDKPIAVFTPKTSAPAEAGAAATGVATASTEPSEAAPIEITFGKLLRKLSVEEIHYILHLTHVYKTLTAKEAPVTSAAGAASGGGGSA